MASSASNAVLSHVVGFFNPNPWPVVINISSVNVNLTLRQKEYVTSRDGRKINDPLLESFVGADMLAKQTSKEGVPQVLFPRPDPMFVSSETGVGVNPTVVKDARGIVQDSSFTKASGQQTAPQTSSSIRTYSVSEAIRKGIIRPMVEPKIEPPKETDGQPMRLDNVPKIDDTIPREASPKEARQIAKDLQEAETRAHPHAEPSESTSAESSQTDIVPALTDEEIKAKTASLLASITPKGKDKKFVCKVDGKSFHRKDRLLEHIKKNYPDQEAQLMEGY